MTTSSEDSVERSTKTIRTPHLLRHQARRRKELAVRSALILGIAMGVLAISDFAYNAYIVTDYVQPRSGDSPDEGQSNSSTYVNDYLRLRPYHAQSGDESESPGLLAAEYIDLMQRDAIAVLFAVALVIGSTVIARKMKRGRRDRDDHTLPGWPFLPHQLEMIFALHRGTEADGAEVSLMRRTARRRMKTAARIALILGLVIVVSAVSDFAYNAHVRSSSLDEIGRMNEGRRIIGDENAASDNSAARRLTIAEELQLLDATAVVLAATLLIGSTVISQRIKRHRRWEVSNRPHLN